jgi:hypothetical protein
MAAWRSRPSPTRTFIAGHRPFIFVGDLGSVGTERLEEIEMDPVSIILVGVSAVLMVALFVWSMNMLSTLDVRPVESDE